MQMQIPEIETFAQQLACILFINSLCNRKLFVYLSIKTV